MYILLCIYVCILKIDQVCFTVLNKKNIHFYIRILLYFTFYCFLLFEMFYPLEQPKNKPVNLTVHN